MACLTDPEKRVNNMKISSIPLVDLSQKVKVLVWQMEGASPPCLVKEYSGSGLQTDPESPSALLPPHYE